MENYMKEELEEALRSITSTLSKSKKVQLKLKVGTFQHTMIVQEIKAYNISIEIIRRELERNIMEDLFKSKYTKEELEEAIQSMTSTVSRVEKIQPKLKIGTSQHTLVVRRIKAFYIAMELIKRKL